MGILREKEDIRETTIERPKRSGARWGTLGHSKTVQRPDLSPSSFDPPYAPWCPFSLARLPHVSSIRRSPSSSRPREYRKFVSLAASNGCISRVKQRRLPSRLLSLSLSLSSANSVVSRFSLSPSHLHGTRRFLFFSGSRFPNVQVSCSFLFFQPYTSVIYYISRGGRRCKNFKVKVYVSKYVACFLFIKCIATSMNCARWFLL